MIIRCPNCNSALVYDIKTGKMKCDSCNSLFLVPNIKRDASEENMMEGEIFSCTSCGATLMVNNVECATHCAYCGQPTVVFERVSKVMRPHKILPFLVTKEEAEQLIRQKLRKGWFVPKEIKRFQVENIAGIYVPFWIFDIAYHDDQLLVESNEDKPRTFRRSETVLFRNMTVDASLQFNNELSERLEPFRLGMIPDFQEAYLSGFYADCYDDSVEKVKERVFQRCKKFYDDESERAVSGTVAKIKQSNPRWEWAQMTYAMLPVWFMTMRYKGKPYTILVNGQTKKVVGAVPFAKGKIFAAFTGLLIFFLSFFPKLGSIIAEGADSEIFGAWAVLALFSYVMGKFMSEQLEDHMKEAMEATEFSKNRDKR